MLLEQVVDPLTGRSLGDLGMVRRVDLRRNRAMAHIVLPADPYPVEEELRAAIERSLAAGAQGSGDGSSGGGGGNPAWLDAAARGLSIELDIMPEADRLALGQRLAASERGHGEAGSDAHADRPHAFSDRTRGARVLGISSGKGGVGKSTVTVNLAVALAERGWKVAVLDADVYGFSVPGMLGVRQAPAMVGELLVPVVTHGVRCMSMGFLVEDDQPIIWRGPMLHKALEQFLSEVYWGAPDYLLIDMPPGTGDVQMGLARMLPRAELLVVTTPGLAAQKVAGRAADMARKGHLRVAGVVENMSGFTCAHGEHYALFGSGGGARLAEEIGAPLVGSVPLDPSVAAGGDTGSPAALDPTSPLAPVFAVLAERIATGIARCDAPDSDPRERRWGGRRDRGTRRRPAAD